MSNDIRIRAWADDKVSGALRKISDQVDHLGKKGAGASFLGNFASAAVTKGIGLAAQGVGMLVGQVDDAINAASNLAEAWTKTEAVFGGNAKQLDKWASTAARTFGQSKRSALEAASGFGNLFDSMGLADKASVDMSKGIVELASDLASFNNVATDDALIALRSGLVGEVEPMRRFGVAINAATVENKALEMGLADTKAEISEADKVMARYKLIMEQTTNAQGDFARTAEGMANQQRTLSALAEDTSAKFGEVLLPIVIEFQQTVIKALDRTSISMEELEEAAAKGSWGARAQLNALKENAEENGQQTAFAIRDVELAFGDMSDEAKKAAGKTERSFTSMVDTLVGETQRLIDDVFDPIEIRSGIYQDRMDQNAAEERLRDAKTAREKREATDDILVSIGDQADALVELGEKGKLTSKDVDRFEKDVKQSYAALGREVPKDIAKIIAKLRQLDSWDGHVVNVKVQSSGVGLKGGDGGNRERRASGGPVKANEVYMVGEEGPELFVSDKHGTIVPNNKLKGGVGPMGLGSSGDVHLHFHGMAYPPTQAQAQELARVVGPAILDYQRRRG